MEDDEINLTVLLAFVERLSTPRQHSGQQRLMNQHNGGNSMRDRDGQFSKKESGDQARAKAAKTSRPTGVNGLLETVRQKMAYTIRGI